MNLFDHEIGNRSLSPFVAAKSLTTPTAFARSASPSATPQHFGNTRRRQIVVVGIFLEIFTAGALACGPFFPNNLLGDGDDALLVGPVTDFERELSLLQLKPARFSHLATTNGYDQQRLDAELIDLSVALRELETDKADAQRIIEAHRENRRKLTEYLEAYQEWEPKPWENEIALEARHFGEPPPFPVFDSVPGLPKEFAEYFEGAVALRQPQSDPTEARQIWQRLLDRPAAERKFKSTWATFMLGKLAETNAPAQAVIYFQQVRELAKQGFADSSGLAAASIGLEARVALQCGHFQRAMQLYLEQYAAGDHSACVSLRWTAAAALTAGGPELNALAAAADTRAVVTAYLISSKRDYREVGSVVASTSNSVAWLAAVEAQNITDVASAERLAIAAYRLGGFDLAQRWADRAMNSPAAQWIRAKLLLREGRIAPAAALLATISRELPLDAGDDLTHSMAMADHLWIDSGNLALGLDEESARARILGELGVLRLTRGDFAEALDALLRADFWEDAAYVAERVLTTDELKNYVDREWPAPSEIAIPQIADGSAAAETTQVGLPDLRAQEIRYLLARRLTRESRGREAENYFPPEWRPQLSALIQSLQAGWNESQPASARAQSFLIAAWITRTNGMELMGTELGPDWFIHDGAYDWGLGCEDRVTSSSGAWLNVAGAAELARVQNHVPDPNKRFHYRYQAASLAWEAAKLLPDNSDETARILCAAGTWLKVRDPDTADIFYKALVRRCRHTAIGAQADTMRWFPVLDDAGDPRPYYRISEPTVPEEAPIPPPPGSINPIESEAGPVSVGNLLEYVIKKGDSLSSIAAACSAAGQEEVLRQILAANPGLLGNRLRVGQRILIPRVDLPGARTDEIPARK